MEPATKLTLSERLAARGFLGKCSQCGTERVPIMADRERKLWCLPCREVREQERPKFAPKVEKSRPEIQVTYEGETYTFSTKKEARSAMRGITQSKRLPEEVAVQISGSRKRRTRKPKKERTTMPSLELTKSQLDTITKSLHNGSTLLEEAKKLGLARGKQLRVALRDHLGAEKYKEAVKRGPKPGGAKKGGGKKKAAAKKGAKKGAKKAAAKKGGAKKKSGGAKKKAAKKVVQKPGATPAASAADEAPAS